MDQYDFCSLGTGKVCNVPCNIQDIPKLPVWSDIIKSCPVPIDDTCYILFVLLLCPISAVVMVAMRSYVLPLVKGPWESNSDSKERAESEPMTTRSTGSETQSAHDGNCTAFRAS